MQSGQAFDSEVKPHEDEQLPAATAAMPKPLSYVPPVPGLERELSDGSDSPDPQTPPFTFGAGSSATPRARSRSDYQEITLEKFHHPGPNKTRVPEPSCSCIAWSVFGCLAGLTEFAGFGTFVGIASVPAVVTLCEYTTRYDRSWLEVIEPLMLANGFFSGLAMMMVVLNFYSFLQKAVKDVVKIQSDYQVSKSAIAASLLFCVFLWTGLSFAPALGLHALDSSETLRLETSVFEKALLGSINGIGNFAVWAMLHAEHVIKAPVNLRSVRLICSRRGYVGSTLVNRWELTQWTLKTIGNCFIYSSRLSFMVLSSIAWLTDEKPTSPSMITIGVLTGISAIYNTFFTQSIEELIKIFPNLRQLPAVSTSQTPGAVAPVIESRRAAQRRAERGRRLKREFVPISRVQNGIAYFLVWNVNVAMTLSTMAFSGHLTSNKYGRGALHGVAFLSCIFCIVPQFSNYIRPAVANGVAYLSELLQFACITAYPKKNSHYFFMECCRKLGCQSRFAPAKRVRYAGQTCKELLELDAIQVERQEVERSASAVSL